MRWRCSDGLGPISFEIMALLYRGYCMYGLPGRRCHLDEEKLALDKASGFADHAARG